MKNACSIASPKIAPRDKPLMGKAVYCVEPIEAGEFVCLIGGETLSLQDAHAMPHDERRQCLQVEEDTVLWISDYVETTPDWINHSCDPNIGVSGQISFVAMRDIAVGEEICFDYAMTDGSPIDEFACGCNSPSCRKTVTGNDWRDPALQKRYRGFFSAYLARRIASL
jgi:uncharacterized protein